MATDTGAGGVRMETTAVPYTVGMPRSAKAAEWPKERRIALRLKLKESVDKFGARFGRSGRTIEDWEQWRRHPDDLVIRAWERLEKD